MAAIPSLPKLAHSETPLHAQAQQTVGPLKEAFTSAGIDTHRCSCHRLFPQPPQLIDVILMLVQTQQAMGRLRSESMLAGPPLYPSATGNIDKCHAHVGPALAIVAGEHACCHHLHCNLAGLRSQSIFSTATACMPVSIASLPPAWLTCWSGYQPLYAMTAVSVKHYPTQSQLLPERWASHLISWCGAEAGMIVTSGGIGQYVTIRAWSAAGRLQADHPVGRLGEPLHRVPAA